MRLIALERGEIYYRQMARFSEYLNYYWTYHYEYGWIDTRNEWFMPCLSFSICDEDWAKEVETWDRYIKRLIDMDIDCLLITHEGNHIFGFYAKEPFDIRLIEECNENNIL